MKHNNILEEHGQNQSNDMLLDEQIMGEDESQDEDHIITDDDHVASEAQRQTASNNLYKFRHPHEGDIHRPKTSNGGSISNQRDLISDDKLS